MQTRSITFGGNTVNIEYQGAGAAKIINFLYQYIPAHSYGPVRATCRLTADDASSRLRVYCDDELLYEGDSEASAAEILMGNTCYHLAYHARNGLMLHAAGLAFHSRGILLPGKSGAGKTTLTAWLLSRGLRYLTDELIFIPEGEQKMDAFTRPLNLKQPSWAILQAQIDFEQQADHILSSRLIDLVSPSLLNPDDTLSTLPLNLIIFPTYQADNDYGLERLSSAQAGMELMLCLVNARNLPGHGFAEIIQLAKTIPTYKLTYAGFGQIEPHLEKLLLKSV